MTLEHKSLCGSSLGFSAWKEELETRIQGQQQVLGSFWTDTILSSGSTQKLRQGVLSGTHVILAPCLAEEKNNAGIIGTLSAH